jgi:hypothetical protein
LNVDPNSLAGRSHFASLHLSSGDECGFAIHNVEDVGLLLMEFDVTASGAVNAQDQKVGSFNQGAAIAQSGRYLFVANVGDRRFSATRRQQSSRRYERQK